MRHIPLALICLGGALVLSACENQREAEVKRAVQTVNAIDDNNLSDIMLTVADPNEAVSYFRRTSAEHPDRIELQRGLAKSLVRAKKNREASAAWAKVVAHPEATSEDRVAYAEALIRDGKWPEAEKTLAGVPPTYESFTRFKLEAMIADSHQQWKKADRYYDTAAGLTTRPAGILNNWGYSKLNRGDYAQAERLFGEALQYDPKLFTAKNNLVLARAAQRNYKLPIIDMTQTERAQLLHSMGLAAVKQGDVNIGKALLQDAADIHPQYFEEAVYSLNALGASGDG